MFVPILMTLDPADEKSWMWVFHKLASIGKGNRWPIVAQKEYFASYKTYEVPNVFKEWYDVSLETNDVLDNIIPIEIPESIINNYIEQYPSQTDAFVNSFVDKWPELVNYLFNRLSKLAVVEGRNIEGLILFRYYNCFENLAKMLNVPTFYFELGLRLPDYRNTFYWSKQGVMGKSGFGDRFARFHKEFLKSPLLILNAKEILALFLRDEKLEYLNKDNSNKYEFGIFGSYSIPMASTAFNKITLSEELMLVRKIFSDDKIIIKTHPSDPLMATPRFPNLEKDGVTSAQFIRKCKRVVCAGSNVVFEAALYGVPAYDLGWSQYSFISNLSLKELTDKLPNEEELSFIAFCCLAPLELLKDIDYIRRAITSDSELEIYKFNLEYYLKDYGLSYDELLNSNNRLELILKSRLHNSYDNCRQITHQVLTPMAELQIELSNAQRLLNKLLEKERLQSEENKKLVYEILKLKEDYDILKNQINILERSNKDNILTIDRLNADNLILKENLQNMEQLYKESDILYNQVLDSTAYKCTKPFRQIGNLINKIHEWSE